MHVICVDDEQPVLDNFKLTVKGMPEIQTLHLFRSGREALKWARNNLVDVAFLDVEMPQKSGIQLAKELQENDPNIRIVFMTAFEQYALDAFKVKAIGYILKPYDYEEVKDALEMASRVKPKPKKRVMIQTIPEFVISVEGKTVELKGLKQLELLALLVDRAQAGLTVGDAISCLWPERISDEKSQALYRTTFYNLMNTLKEEGIDYIIKNDRRHKAINMDQVDCDLYRILAGDTSSLANYTNMYMGNYSWAEVRNAQLFQMKKEM